MDNKMQFAETISDLDNRGLSMSDCMKYGMTWGCDEDCPVLNEGNCEIYLSVEDYYKENEE